MAMRTMNKQFLSRSELILRSLPKFIDSKEFEMKYNHFLSGLKTINTRDASNFLSFPTKTFQRFSYSSIDNLIKSSYNVMKKKNAIDNIYVYNTVLNNYIKHDIVGDISTVLNDMKDRNVSPNNMSYILLIDIYSGRGEMDAVKNVIDIMKAQNVILPEKSKYKIYGGYIRANQFERAEEFVKEENLNENISLLVQCIKAYADNGQFNEVIETYNKIKEIDEKLHNKLCLNIYRRLVKAKASYFELEKILSFANSIKNRNVIIDTVFYLNKFGFYNHSLNIMIKFSDVFDDKNVIADIISSFNNADCPINIYKTVLERHACEIYPSVTLNMFANCDYEEAYKVINEIINHENFQCLVSSLLVKVIKENLIIKISDVLKIGYTKNYFKNLNSIIQFVLIPSLLQYNIILKAEDCLELLPQYKGLILPSLLMHLLCKRDFMGFESLIKNYKIDGNLKYTNMSRSNAKNIINCFSLKEIYRIHSMVSDVFSSQFVNWFIGSIVTEKLIQMSITDNIDNLDEVIEMSKKLDIVYDQKDIEYLMKHTSKHQHISKALMEYRNKNNDESLIDK